LSKNRFVLNLAWELKNLFRFPFPEVLLGLFTFMVFLPRLSVFAGTLILSDLSWQEITRQAAYVSAQRASFYSVSAYLPMAILGSIFATLAFAYEIENGLLKVHLSHPAGKRTIYLSKWLSCFLIIFTTLSCALLFFAFLYIPQNDLYLIVNFDLAPGILLLAALEAFFVVSVTVSFSIFSRKASVSLVGSFAALYIVQLLSGTSGMTFLPPTSFDLQARSMFSPHSISFPRFYAFPDFLIVPIASAVLTITSYIYFSKGLELA